MTHGTPLSGWLHRLLLLTLGCLVGCSSFEEKRIRELLHEKGFGTRAEGDSNRENYVTGLDTIQFLIEPTALAEPGLERLAELTVKQPIAIDGTIFVPYVGPVYVLGKTELEVSALVQGLLKEVLTNVPEIQARIITSVRFYYAIGETLQKGRIAMEPDMTFIDAVFKANWTNLANLGRVYLIRPDAETPLVIDINFREMVTSGYTTANVLLRERDILYVPPTFLGLIARMLQRLLEPVALAVRTMLGFAEIQSAYDYVTGKSGSYYLRF
jgi:protein involved in polysaccharide export with SLBB domain